MHKSFCKFQCINIKLTIILLLYIYMHNKWNENSPNLGKVLYNRNKFNILFIVNLQSPEKTHAARTQHQTRQTKTEQLDWQKPDQKKAEQDTYNFTLIQEIQDSEVAEKQEFIEKIKKQELQKTQMARLSIQAKIRLDQIHYLINADIEGNGETHESLLHSCLNRRKQNSEQGSTYFLRLMRVVMDISFLDLNVLRSLCNQFKGQNRVMLLTYYIDWAFATQYGGTIFKYIQSCWEDLKFKVAQIIDSIKGAMKWIWEKLKSAWNSLFA